MPRETFADKCMTRNGKIVILTGAGLSAESGLSTFRDEGGLWSQHRIEDVATPEAFARNPDLVQAFYNARRAQSRAATPNAAHVALARLQRDHGGEVVIVTQNVDGLHEKAGAKVIHLHGALDSALCHLCDHRWTAPETIDSATPCPACGHHSARPDVVWFGEMPYHMEEIAEHLENADIFASIGTSGQVYPAAGFSQLASDYGAECIELNLEPTSHVFHQRRIGHATQTILAWVEELIGA
ncbi:NAD-dependent deacylase [Sagittula stellata]|uniref:NAD-dependent protein deacylase n=2 Tax=Sagittula stellata TaxID=52603 RepID=A3K6Z0_SAGS3|nr:NAD-dependent deacylase [Sagittula stellata]EBA07117.1 NAD-dependent deacetylase [Sagittula stellata E-37]